MHIVAANEMYVIDRWTMEQAGLPGVALMENAGQAAAKRIMELVRRDDRITLLIGTGNNGGDGFVIARVLKSHGYEVEAWLIPPVEKIKGDAFVHMQVYLNAGYDLFHWEKEGGHALFARLERTDVTIDAMFGIGFKGAVRAPFHEIIEKVNECRGLKIAIDLPSGLEADEAVPAGVVFKADITITLHLPKRSAFLYPAAEWYGKLEVTDIGIPPLAQAQLTGPARKIWTKQAVFATFPKRLPSSHKSSHGRGLLIGGSRGMTGAPVLAARAALRSGAGLLTTAVPDCVHQTIASQLAEAMYSPWPSVDGAFSGEAIPMDLSHFDAIAVGPGMGRSEGARQIVASLLQHTSVPLIIDADGLFHLASLKEELKARSAPVILTPHTGEMARLTGLPAAEVDRRRFDVARQFALETGCHLVLKGPYTIVTAPTGEQLVNTTGNASLAKGGSGDVLTGMILAMVMQHQQVSEALANAVFVHGKAADHLIETGHSLSSVLATDVIEALPAVLRDIS